MFHHRISHLLNQNRGQNRISGKGYKLYRYSVELQCKSRTDLWTNINYKVITCGVICLHPNSWLQSEFSLFNKQAMASVFPLLHYTTNISLGLSLVFPWHFHWCWGEWALWMLSTFKDSINKWTDVWMVCFSCDTKR